MNKGPASLPRNHSSSQQISVALLHLYASLIIARAVAVAVAVTWRL